MFSVNQTIWFNTIQILAERAELQEAVSLIMTANLSGPHTLGLCDWV